MSSAPVTEAGKSLSLTCRVVVVEYLVVSPQVEWRQPDGAVISSGGNPSAGDSTQVSGTMSTHNVSFTPLLTSHAVRYLCATDISIPDLPQSVNNTVYSTVFV